MALDLGNGVSRRGVGVQRSLCCHGKVGTLAPVRGGVHALCRAVGTNSRCGLAGLRRWVRGRRPYRRFDLGRDAGLRSRMSPTAAGGQKVIEGRAVLMPSAGA